MVIVMNRNELMDIIKSRRSVRTFDGKQVTKEDRDKLQNFCDSLTNPFHVPVEFQLLDPKEHGLKSPVLSGETLYLAAKVKNQPMCDVAFGYAFEAAVLFAESIGLGTAWLGATMNRDAFERAIELKADEIMPCVTPVGYQADRMSMREVMMRKGYQSDTRLSLAEIAFDEEYGKSFDAERDRELTDILEMVRWAPSAVNKQPWRIIVTGKNVHFYEKPVSIDAADLQRIDIGIAMYHFACGLEAYGKDYSVNVNDPKKALPGGVEYIASFIVA